MTTVVIGVETVSTQPWHSYPATEVGHFVLVAGRDVRQVTP